MACLLKSSTLWTIPRQAPWITHTCLSDLTKELYVSTVTSYSQQNISWARRILLQTGFSGSGWTSATGSWIPKFFHPSPGPYSLDLFVSRWNHHLPRYYSWLPNPNAMATDAFTLPIPRLLCVSPLCNASATHFPDPQQVLVPDCNCPLMDHPTLVSSPPPPLPEGFPPTPLTCSPLARPSMGTTLIGSPTTPPLSCLVPLQRSRSLPGLSPAA